MTTPVQIGRNGSGSLSKLLGILRLFKQLMVDVGMLIVRKKPRGKQPVNLDLRLCVQPACDTQPLMHSDLELISKVRTQS